MLFGYAARFVNGLPVSALLVVKPYTNTDSSRATATVKPKPKGIIISPESSTSGIPIIKHLIDDFN